NQLYLGDEGRHAVDNRSVLAKRAVRERPTAGASALYASLAAGQLNLAPQTNEQGCRWLDKSGSWIDYNTQGQVVAYGDRNHNTVWLARDEGGRLLGVVDPWTRPIPIPIKAPKVKWLTKQIGRASCRERAEKAACGV